MTRFEYLYFDAETIPSQDPEYIEELKAKVSAPVQYKKPESIEKWLEENRNSEAQKMAEKTSFDGGRGHVCTISWAKDDGEIEVAHAKTLADERHVIEEFFAVFDPYHSTQLVGHNITGFDIGFLRKRAICLGIKMPDRQSFPRDPKPWDRNVFDTMTAWVGGTNRISLDELCSILGIEGKDGLDGSQVAEAWANGEHDKIAEYCKSDVHRVREIHRRFIAAGY